MLLGDQGAEVIKVEPLPGGDGTRLQPNPRIGDENTAFLSVNRNKLSVALDLRQEAGQALVRRLTRQADVFVENFRPGVAEDMGLGWDALRADNPRLVYASISGWGSTGPDAQRAGYAATAEAASGLMSVTGETGGDPVKIGSSLLDNLAGVFAKDAITAALFARERGGAGQRVEVSLFESALATLSMVAYAELLAGTEQPRSGSAHPYVAPFKAHATADGHIMVVAGKDDQYQRLCAALGAPDLAADPRYATRNSRADHRAELYAALDRRFAARTTAEWLETLDRAKLAVAPVNSVRAAFAEPQASARQMVQTVEHATLGPIAQVGHAQKFSATPATMRSAPPVLGADTVPVLRDRLGLSDAEIARLQRERVIAAAGPS
jgi:crotonobetainyl-CoA:carnitine CoA-transferase CaiB-like acyl-CoA transferase